MNLDEAKALVEADMPDRAVAYDDLVRVMLAGRTLVAEVERLQTLVRTARQLQLGWEVADNFSYEDQAGEECKEFTRNFDAETERLIAAAEAKGGAS